MLLAASGTDEATNALHTLGQWVGIARTGYWRFVCTEDLTNPRPASVGLKAGDPSARRLR